MSRCAQGAFPTNSRRKIAALIAPPQRSPWFFMSATSDRSVSLCRSTSGSRQNDSPARAAAESSSSASVSVFENSPATQCPSATTHAPVSVATSTSAAGFCSTA
jgi:hypothetical protein